MQLGVNKLARGGVAAVLVIGASVLFASVPQDANAQRRIQSRQNIQPYYYGGFTTRDPSPFATSRDGRFDPVPPSANGG